MVTGFSFRNKGVTVTVAEFRSRLPELGFYVKGTYHQFRSGILRTEDPDVIRAANALDGVERVDKEPEQKEPEKTSEAKPKKAAPKKKAAKTSGK